MPNRCSVSHQALSEPGHRDRLRTVEIFIVDGVEHIMRRARLRSIGVRPDRKRNGALAVDEAVAAVAEPDMRHAAADDPDHHRLDHGQREQGRDRRIDGVAAGGEHLRARGRGQRMIADHHAAAARCRLLLTIENRARAIPPVTGHGGASPLYHRRKLCTAADLPGIWSEVKWTQPAKAFCDPPFDQSAVIPAAIRQSRPTRLESLSAWVVRPSSAGPSPHN